MKAQHRKTIFRAILALAAALLIAAALIVLLTILPRKVDPKAPLKGIPIHVMEYHIWWSNPFYGPENERAWGKWNEASGNALERAAGPSWRRITGSGAMPLIGCYNSAQPDVIRWQLRCAKAAGITALQVQLFPNQKDGSWFGREEVFAEIVRIAGEEQMPVYIHDEVQFRKPPATDPQVMTDRLTTALNRYGSLPGYYKIGGKPAVSFQYWRPFARPDEIARMASLVNRSVPGGVQFVVNGRFDPVFDDAASLNNFVMAANSVFIKNSADRSVAPDWDALRDKLWKLRFQRLARVAGIRPNEMRFGLWAYPGFDDTKTDAESREWFSRGQNLTTFRETLRRYAAERPDFIVLSSWNDWQENTALEPALDVDGFNGDPYQALRTIAELQGKTFIPPPLPPPDAMDPWLSAHHGGPDKTPPRVVNIRREADGIRWTLVDETSPIGKFEIARAAAIHVQPDSIEAHGRKGAKLNRDFKIELDPEMFSNAGDVWLAVTVWDGAREDLAISYPANPPELWDPVDAMPISRNLALSLRGEQRWRTKLFALHGFEVTSERKTITFHAAKNEDVVLAAASVFRESDLRSDEITELSASADRCVVTSRTSGPSLDATNDNPHAIITGQDVNGNRALPIAIDLTNAEPNEVVRVED